MGILKVVVNTTETERVLYTELPENYRTLLDFLNDNIKSDLNFSLYWIDTDNDKVEVNNENAFNMFCRLSTNKKLFVGDRKNSPLKEKNEHLNNGLNTEKKDKSTYREKGNKHHSHKDGNPSKTVHYGVQCDSCDVLPIVGFRYKCLQCPDYDLCMTCENKFIHSSHKMLRIPDKLFKRGNYGWRFCNPLFQDIFQKDEAEPTAETGGKCHNGESHHRRRRCHREGGRPGFISNFVQMMNDMAEGEKSKNNSNCKKGNDNNNDDNINQDCFMDPELIKTGVEVLSNFGEMFSKMIDPLNITVEVDVDGAKSSLGTKTNLNDDSVSTKDNETTKANNNSAKVSAEQNLNTNIKTNVQAEPSNNHAKENENLMETRAGASASISSDTRKQTHNDMDWTIIDDSIDTNRNLNQNNMTKEVPINSLKSSNLSIEQTENPKISFSQLNKDLENHIREEKTKEATNRAVKTDIVYHNEPHINNAVIAMIAMGFSNEGKWLTHLLESVNGDISQALDLLKPAK